MKSEITSTELYRRWIYPDSWLNRLYKGLALVKGKFTYLPVQSLPRVDINLPLSVNRQFWYGIHRDQHLLKFLVQSLPLGGVFLDIGGNIGIYSTTLWKAKSGNIKICTFEPVPSTLKALRKTFALNHVEAHIEPIALSSEEGELLLSAYENGANNYWINKYQPKNVPTVSLPKMRLDDWCNQHQDWIPHAMKIDVEGHELEVLKGAQQVLQTHKPALVVECHCASWDELGVSRREFIDFINSLGYSKLSDIHGRTINFETQASTIHLLCYP
ncbi:MAG: FkbM family methyltransferase [Xenococcus sp. (in: cyanobacteria)]